MAIAIVIVMNWNWRFKNNMLRIATDPLKKNNVLNVDKTSLLFFIPLPRTWELDEIEKINQKIINMVLRIDQGV